MISHFTYLLCRCVSEHSRTTTCWWIKLLQPNMEWVQGGFRHHKRQLLARQRTTTHTDPVNKYKLRFELQSNASGLWYWAEYDTFTVGDESTSYKLTIGGFSGNSLDALKYSNGAKFSTMDHDNDLWSGNCAQQNGGGFWYSNCGCSHITETGDKFYWHHMSSSSDYKLRTSRMWLVCR